MKWILFALLFATIPAMATPATWFIRPDGGTRFSANQPTGQCDGLADAAYSGTGTNQHCAFNDFRYMWDDQSYQNDAWVMAGGDTVLIEGCAATAANGMTNQCRIGWDSNTGQGAGFTWCFGRNNNNCNNPTIPAGTSGQHTRILGKNFASCSTGNTTNRASLTQIFGGYGVGSALNMAGANYVDVECIELTRHSQCVQHGTINPQCNSGTPDDFVSNGISTDINMSNILMQDLWIHGVTASGIVGQIGPAGPVNLTRVNIGYNGGAGWSMDPGVGGVEMTANQLNWSYVTLEWNGCDQNYPFTGALSCYDDQSPGTTGYGDALGTRNPELLNLTSDHGIGRYNTQDYLDVGHVQNSTVVITNSVAYGNMGGNYKSGTNDSFTLINNIALSNCNRMSAPITGAITGFNAQLSDYCRASADGNGWNFTDARTQHAVIENNTFIGYGGVLIDGQCAEGVGLCSASTTVFKNNLVLGLSNPFFSESGIPAGQLPSLFNTLLPTTQDHNLIWNARTCPAVSGDTSPTCVLDTKLVNQPALVMTSEQVLDNFDFYPSAASPAIGAGVTISGITTDNTGVLRAIPPAIGALEPLVGTHSTTVNAPIRFSGQIFFH